MGYKSDTYQTRTCGHHPETCTCRDLEIAIRLEREELQVTYTEGEVQELLIKCVDVFGDGTLSDKETDKKVVEWFNRYKKK
jgi:hypothetical protein